ncbi:MAG: glycosyltransferase family 39 protein [Candidatus Omnitrophota bacterium]
MNKTWKYIVMLLGIFLFHLVANYQVLTQSQIPHINDEQNRIIHGFKGYEAFFLKSDISLQQKIILITQLDKSQAHPPLFEMMEILSWKILSMIKRMDVELMILTTNAFFLALLLLSVFGIGTLLCSRGVGLLAALLTSFFPSIFGLSRTAMLDFPLTCMVALSFFVLLKTHGFTSRVYSMLFGAVAGLSVLTKEAAALFLIAPTSYYVIKAYLVGHKRQAVLNMLMALLCFFFVAGMIYLRPDNFQAYGLYARKIAIQGFGANNAFYYLEVLPDLVGPWLLLPSISLLVYYSIDYFIDFKKKDGFLLVWCLIPILCFSFSPNRVMRFMLPIMPAFALILAKEALASPWPKRVRRACGLALAVLSVTQYGFYHAGYLKGANWTEFFSEKGLLSITRQGGYLRAVSDLFDVFKNEATQPRRRRILLLFNGGEIQGPLAIKLMIAHLDFKVGNPLATDASDLTAASRTRCLEEMLSADYVLDLEGGTERNHGAVSRQLEDCLNENFSEHRDDFKKITEGIVYDNALIYVYKRIRR